MKCCIGVNGEQRGRAASAIDQHPKEDLLRQLRRPRAARIVVHKYKERLLTFTTLGNGKPPYDLHFYPGLGKLLVTGESQF